MSIQSTQHIPRSTAISRIEEIYNLVIQKDYKQIAELSYENDWNVEQFVETHEKFAVAEISKWTNAMLERVMDKPFYRYSCFDNYIIDEN